jgi:hypothetical protein
VLAHAEVAIPKGDESTVTLPDQPLQPVEFTGEGGSFELTPTLEHSLQEVSLTDENLVEIATTIELSSGEVSGEYALEMPTGSTAHLISNEQGDESVLLTNGDGEFLGGLMVEAVDAGGAHVNVALSLENNVVTYTPVISDASVAYPLEVRATGGTVWYSRAWVSYLGGGKYVVNAVPTALGRQQTAANVHNDHVQHLKSLLGGQAYRVNYTIE